MVETIVPLTGWMIVGRSEKAAGSPWVPLPRTEVMPERWISFREQGYPLPVVVRLRRLRQWIRPDHRQAAGCDRGKGCKVAPGQCASKANADRAAGSSGTEASSLLTDDRRGQACSPFQAGVAIGHDPVHPRWPRHGLASATSRPTPTLRRRPLSYAGTSSRIIHFRMAISAVRSWSPSNSWSATAELGSQRLAIRMRPTASSARSRVAT